MPGRMDDFGLEVTNGECFIVFKKMVKICSIGRGIVAGLKNGNPGGDDIQHVPAHGYLAAQPFLEVAGGGNMVRMNVCFKYPLYLKLFPVYKCNNRICGCRAGAA